MKTFKLFKEKFITDCKSNNACQSEFKRVLDSKNKNELLKVIFDNINWIYDEKKILTIDDLLNNFTQKQLTKVGLYIKYNSVINDLKKSIVLISSSPTIETWGSSSPTIETLDSSSPTIKTLDSSSPTIETWDSSSPTIETWDSSSISYLPYSNNLKILSQKGNSCINDLINHKLYIIKNKFEIIEL